jgi:hypothetical protein
MNKVIDISELALILKKSPSTIRSDMVRAPARLPPSFTMPGSRKRLWLLETVEAYVMANAAKAGALPPPSASKATDGKG